MAPGHKHSYASLHAERLHCSVTPVPGWILGPSRVLQTVLLHVIRRRLGHATVLAVTLALNLILVCLLHVSLLQSRFAAADQAPTSSKGLQHKHSSIYMCGHTFLHFHGILTFSAPRPYNLQQHLRALHRRQATAAANASLLSLTFEFIRVLETLGHRKYL